jgi:hypothetical protein
MARVTIAFSFDTDDDADAAGITEVVADAWAQFEDNDHGVAVSDLSVQISAEVST